jgi:hypothetical protein
MECSKHDFSKLIALRARVRTAASEVASLMYQRPGLQCMRGDHGIDSALERFLCLISVAPPPAPTSIDLPDEPEGVAAADLRYATELGGTTRAGQRAGIWAQISKRDEAAGAAAFGDHC